MVSMYVRVRPSTAARASTSATACSARRGSGPHVPELRYARSLEHGELGSEGGGIHGRAQYPGRCAGGPRTVTSLQILCDGPAPFGRAPRVLA